jgi:RNA polymerase sigma-70 factor (ECF subfamily)
MKVRSRQNDVAAVAAIEQPQSAPFDEDALFVERFLAGDAHAFERLYEKYYEKVFALARGILVNSEDAADAAQEVFSLVYRNVGRFNRRSRFSTWLFRVAVNRIIQHGRRLKSRSREVELTEAEPQSVPHNAWSVDPAIEQAFKRLAPTDRAILVLFYWEELSLSEIAESIGCGVNAAKTRIYRARERFRQAYGEDR